MSDTEKKVEVEEKKEEIVEEKKEEIVEEEIVEEKKEEIVEEKKEEIVEEKKEEIVEEKKEEIVVEKKEEIVVEKKEKLGETKPIRHPKFPELIDSPYKGITTVSGVFGHAVKKFGDKNCFGWRELIKMHKKEIKQKDGTVKIWETPEKTAVKWITFNQAQKVIDQIASGLIKFAGLKNGDMFGIYATTCKEWQMTFQACAKHGFPVVTCYANLGVEALIHVINQTECTTMLCEGAAIKTLDKLADKCKSLKNLIYLGKKSNDSKNFKLISFDELCKKGEKEESVVKPPTKDDVACIMYTSGSTGLPKGVMIAHKNFTAVVGAALKGINFTEKDFYLGYLPLAHILELSAENAVLCAGAAIGYGNPRHLTDRTCKPMGDIRAVRPTIMAGVPRVWDTIMKGALEKINSAGGLKKMLFDTAFEKKLHWVRRGEDTPFWNWLIFNKLAPLLGGRMRVMISGGAPLSKETNEFCKVCFNCSIIQGYGLTETTGGGTFQDPQGKLATLNVGFPAPSCEIKLVDVPDMNYTHKDKPVPRGEIAIRGHNISLGYYKNKKKTDEEFRDGWFFTGDIGRFNPDGTLSIIDRKKNLVKLAMGEYVALENLEMMYGSNNPFVAANGICIYADSMKSRIVGLVIPQISYCQTWAKQNGVDSDMSELIKNKKFKDAVNAEFKKIGTSKKKKKFEFLGDFTILNDEWTPENECLTAAMKLKRNNIYKKFQSILDAMYDGLKK